MLKKEFLEKGYIDEPAAEGTDLKVEIRRMAKEKDAQDAVKPIQRMLELNSVPAFFVLFIIHYLIVVYSVLYHSFPTLIMLV